MKATDNDVHLYAYYPGKSFANVKRAVDDRQVKIVMQSGKHKSVQRQPAQNRYRKRKTRAGENILIRLWFFYYMISGHHSSCPESGLRPV